MNPKIALPFFAPPFFARLFCPAFFLPRLLRRGLEVSVSFHFGVIFAIFCKNYDKICRMYFTLSQDRTIPEPVGYIAGQTC